MRRQLAHCQVDLVLDSAEKGGQLGVAHQVGHRVMALRRDALAKHHLDPGVLGEQFIGSAEHASGLAEQFDPVAQRGRDVELSAGAPERRVLALGDDVVQHDEIADVGDLGARLLVVFVDVRLADAAV